MKDYRICSRCIMDTSDPYIEFDQNGCCNHCANYINNILPHWHPNEEGEQLIAKTIERIKLNGKGRVHDCLIGLSGGLDSSYLSYVAKERFGLRPMIFHVDAGWNSERGVKNVERIVDGLRLDLYTEVVDWEEMKDLQLAFFKSQVPDQDVPQDLAFFAALYNFAAKEGFKYILTGGNFSTECVREPIEWGGYYATDLRYVYDIHSQFGRSRLQKFPRTDIFKYKLQYRLWNGVRMVKILNNVRYIKEEAEHILGARFGWEAFQHKHHESRFTRFFESYWLPRKFGWEKRRAHFSSLILTKQMERKAALERISRPELDEETMAQEFEYVAKKLDLSVDQFQGIFKGGNKSYRDYKNRRPLITLGTRVLQALGIERRRFQ
jgi:N-acetyl sugar amidotransferase